MTKLDTQQGNGKVKPKEFIQVESMEILDADNESPETERKQYAKAPLNTLQDVKKEMGKVYRLVKVGKLDSTDGWRRINMLSQIGKTIVDGILELEVDRAIQQARIANGKPQIEA